MVSAMIAVAEENEYARTVNIRFIGYVRYIRYHNRHAVQARQ